MDILKELPVTAEAKIDRSHYQTVIKFGDHTLTTDEPLAAGGTDEAMSPMGLLLASVGGCTAITLRMYIDRKMWAVDEITVDVELIKITGETQMELKLSFKGDLSDEQRNRLVQIANACPIHKILTGKITMGTGLK